MKLNVTKGDNFISVTKTYDPGEKYLSKRRWNRADGKVTKEKVEELIPGSRFVEIRHERMFTTDLDYVTRTSVMVEMTA